MGNIACHFSIILEKKNLLQHFLLKAKPGETCHAFPRRGAQASLGYKRGNR